MSVIEDVERYEVWLKTQCNVVEDGLDEKHRRMSGDAFMFFRATCFRFARKFTDWFGDLADAPRVPSVGDAHIENFGTWRDDEGRLVWGINDFDEAALLPWTCDLVRLATSACLGKDLPGTKRARVTAILEGYILGLIAPGPQFVDDERPWLQALVLRPGEAGGFRKDLDKIKRGGTPEAVATLLDEALPRHAVVDYRGSWQKGGGSLGRPRHVTVANWQGGPAVREAKALVSSAWVWGANYPSRPDLFAELSGGPYRSPDPFLMVKDGWVVRRIAPDSVKIDLSHADARVYGPQLLSAMGRELAAVHVTGGVTADTILADLRRRPDGWLVAAARRGEKEVAEDFADWVKVHPAEAEKPTR